MAAADRVWLGLDSPRNLMVVTAVLEFAEPVDVRRLHAVLADRLLAAYPRFGQRLVPGGWPFRAPRWLDAEVDLDVHLQRRASGGAPLPTVVETLLSSPLDLSRPPWQCHLVTSPTGEALVVRLHHCLADGIALAGVLLALTDGPTDAFGGMPSPSRPAPAPVGVCAAARLLAGMAACGLRLLLLPREPRTALIGRPGVPKRAAWTSGLPLAEVQAVADSTGGSINDVLLAVTAGALRRYVLATGGRPRDLRVFVPVNVRSTAAAPTAQLGNRFGLVFPQLPVAVADPVDRVAAVTRRMATLKATAEALTTNRMIGVLGAFPPWLPALAGHVLGAKASAVVTNVPGPRQSVSLAGAQVSRLTYWVPQVGAIGVGISIFSYAGTVSVGVATDAGLVPDPSRLTEAMTAEFAELRRAVGG